MTLEESQRQALAAAKTGDLKRLAEALQARREAIARLQREAASVDLAARMREAFEAGEAIGHALFQSKQRLGRESARLTRLAETFAIGSRDSSQNLFLPHRSRQSPE